MRKDKRKKREAKVKQKRQQREAHALVEDTLSFARWCLMRGDAEEALHLVDKVLRTSPRTTLAYRIGLDACRRLGNTDKKISYLLRYLKVEDTNVRAWYDLACCLYQEERFDEAGRAVDECERLLAAGHKGSVPAAQARRLSQIVEHQLEIARVAEARFSKPFDVPKTRPTAGRSRSTPPPEESGTHDTLPGISIRFAFEPGEVLERLEAQQFEPLALYDSHLRSHAISLYEGFDELLCLNAIRDVQQFWYQIETVRKILRQFRGRVLLCDEVGLGKTIEAGLALKEYALRGLAKKVLILTPASLTTQWRDEMATKFGLEFITTDDSAYQSEGADFWRKHERIIASISTAKSRRNFSHVTSLDHDLVIVDEAHHLKNIRTLNWQLVNALRKKFIFLLTATPVQNDLMELYHLITLLQPGQLKTGPDFRKRFIHRGQPRRPKNRDRLRELLSEVMVRNTRSVADVDLPPRYATTALVETNGHAGALYQRVTELVRSHSGTESPGLERLTLSVLQAEAGSSPAAVGATVAKVLSRPALPAGARDGLQKIAATATEQPSDGKVEKLLELVQANDLKKIVFTQFVATQQLLAEKLRAAGIRCALFQGSMSQAEKEASIESFRNGVDLLVSTESGGEGRNLQFCNTMINYDLPWNPMRIEQRIGRIHRIGQEREVFIFNLAGKGSVEEHVLSILDQKINMFELVIGELDMILGNLSEDREFSDIVFDIWARSADEVAARRGFDELGDQLVAAKRHYEEVKQLDEELFSEDFEV